MALKDSELEQILKEALNDNAIPSAQLNEKLKEKLRNNNKKRSFVFSIPKTVAAAVMLAAVIGVGGFVEKFNPVVDNAQISKNDNIPMTTRTVEINKEKNEELITQKPIEKNALGITESKNTPKKEAVKSNEEITTQASETVQNNAASQSSDTVFKEEKTSENNKNYKYMEIAATGLGDVIDTLNETVNSYIDTLAGTHSQKNDMVMVASAREFAQDTHNENTEKQGAFEETQTEDLESSLPEAICSYEVLCDSENYYSVMTTVKFSDSLSEEYKKSYTVDKNINAVISLLELCEQNPKYREEINNNLQKQMQADEDFRDTYYEISGYEEFYINSNDEVVIIFGEKEFNVGNLN